MNDLALLPHPSIVLPDGQIRPRVFEQHLLSMVSSCVMNNDGFAMCLITDQTEDQPAELFAHGTLVKIIDWEHEDRGPLVVYVQGFQIFRIVDSSINNEGFWIGKGELRSLEQKVVVRSQYL